MVTVSQKEVKVPDICIFKKNLIALPKELFFGHFWHAPHISCFIVLFFHDKCSVRTGAHCYPVLVKNPSREMLITLRLLFMYMKEIHSMKYLYLIS